VRTIEKEFDNSLMINKLHIAYEPVENDLNINYQLGDNVPDMSAEDDEGYSFYSSDLYKNQTEDLAPDSVLFFAMWGNSIDWANITSARLVIKFNNVGEKATNNTGGSLLSYIIDLDVFPDKKIAVGYYDLRQNHLNSGVVIYYQFITVDKNNNYIGDPIQFNSIKLLSNYTGANFEEMVYKFGIQMSETKKLATYEKSWTVNSVEDLPTEGFDDVFIARYEQNNDDITIDYFIYQDLDDAVIETLVFDFDNAVANFSKESCLLNAGIITDGNQLMNGDKYLYGVKSHKPNKPVRRASKVLFKFRSVIKIGDTIGIRFNVWGRSFIKAADGWEDYESINITEVNQINVDERTTQGLEPAIIDGGMIMSSFISSTDQARRKLKRMLFSQVDGLLKRTIKTQGYSEMRVGQLIRLFTTITGDNYSSYGFITSCKPSGEENQIEMIETKAIRLSDTEIEPFAADLNFNLSDLIDQLTSDLKQFQIGTVLAQKYRGTYKVQLEDNTIQKYVISRVEVVGKDDRVALVQNVSGNYVIIEVIQPSLINRDMEDLLAPSDEDYEEWENDIINETGDFEQYPSVVDGRPMGNIISMSSLVADTIHENILPQTGATFTLKVGHDCASFNLALGVSSVTSFITNLANFVYLSTSSGTNYIQCQTEKIATGTYRIYPQSALPLGETIEVGIAPVNSSHPYWGKRGYKGPEISMRNYQANALLTGEWSKGFTVQPELKIEVTFKGTTYIEIEANQALDNDSVMDNDNYYIENIEAQ
jgi:hypothetical protein